MPDQSTPLLIIAGPTASGKTARAIERAQQTNGVILSADSRMVYRGLDIGTGKPTWEHRILSHSPWIEPSSTPFGPVYSITGVDHYLLDIVPPEISFTLADWLARARAVIDHLQAHGYRPIVTGGTGLYIRALLAGYDPPPTDPTTRTVLAHLSTERILDELASVDPITATRERANRRRLVRALEVYRLTGQPISHRRRTRNYRAQVEILEVPRTQLWTNIDRRIDERLAGGMLEEVQQLLRAVSPEWLHRLGLEYRIISEWLLAGQKDQAVLRANLQREIRAYARRQETFLRTLLAP